ncbi:unnamed protein product [Caenorhabditis auriculariae]|uniref:Uncharacterized protein n=1 Tax=Caenorhabditis auriculariae TaxID=2777116 RepID=A0A8S1HCZ2_9PELO|nr:unnamed protein product [Caenorhabditis auriculariae]
MSQICNIQFKSFPPQKGNRRPARIHPLRDPCKFGEARIVLSSFYALPKDLPFSLPRQLHASADLNGCVRRPKKERLPKISTADLQLRRRNAYLRRILCS